MIIYIIILYNLYNIIFIGKIIIMKHFAISSFYLLIVLRFRRKCHSGYIGLRELITNAVGFKKNSE